MPPAVVFLIRFTIAMFSLYTLFWLIAKLANLRVKKHTKKFGNTNNKN